MKNGGRAVYGLPCVQSTVDPLQKLGHVWVIEDQITNRISGVNVLYVPPVG